MTRLLPLQNSVKDFLCTALPGNCSFNKVKQIKITYVTIKLNFTTHPESRT